MISNDFVTQINDRLNVEATRRTLIKYFFEKGYSENFDRSIFPPLIADMVEAIPALQGKIEIIPYAEEVDPQTGYCKLAWNLFVLGNQRLFLGFTEHTDLSAFDSDSYGQLLSDERISRNEATPRRVVTFISRILSSSKSGVIRRMPEGQTLMSTSANTGSGQFFKKTRN